MPAADYSHSKRDAIAKNFWEVRKIQKYLYTLKYKHLMPFIFLLVASVPLCNSNSWSSAGSTPSSPTRTCLGQQVKCRQWAALCIAVKGAAPSSTPGPGHFGQTETQQGALTGHCTGAATHPWRNGNTQAGSNSCQHVWWFEQNKEPLLSSQSQNKH